MSGSSPAPSWRPWGPRPVIERVARTPLARGSALSVAGLVAQGALRFVTSWLVGTVAGRESFGQVATAISLATILSLLWPTSAGAAMSKFVARSLGAGDVEGARALAGFIGATTAVAAVVAAVVAVPAWLLVGEGTPLEGLLVGLLAVGLAGYALVRGALFSIGLVERAAAADVVSATIGLGGLAALLATGVRGIALVLPLTLACLVYAVLGWPTGSRPRSGITGRAEVARFIALTSLGTAASTGFLQLSQVVVRSTQGTAEAGEYAAALTLATPASLLVTALSLVLLPSLAEAWGRGDRAAFRAQADGAMRGIATVMVGVLGPLAIGSTVVVAAVWSPEYARVADVLPVLVLAVLVTTLGVASVSSLNVASERGVLVTTVASVSGMAVGALVWLLTARDGGMLAVAAGYLCGVLVLAGVPVLVAVRRDRQPWGGLLLKVLLAVVVAAAVVVAERWTGAPAWVSLVAAVAFGAAWCALQRRDLALVLGTFRSRS